MSIVLSRFRESQKNVEIYDCIIFYNELELLEVRLNELNDVVDKHIIIESPETFQGGSKKLYYQNNKNKFEEFENKIIHSVMEYPPNINEAWDREHYSRNCIKKILDQNSEISPSDKVIISDADEIPNPGAIKSSKKKKGIQLFSQDLHYYFFNSVSKGQTRYLNSIMIEYGRLESPQDLRDKYQREIKPNRIWPRFLPFSLYKYVIELELSARYCDPIQVIPNAGWHFSYLGDIEFIKNKLESFSHTEYNNNKYKDARRIKHHINNNQHLYKDEREFEIIELGESYPNYLLDNQDKFSEYIK